MEFSEFNWDNCKAFHVGGSNQFHRQKPWNNQLDNSSSQEDLGVMVDHQSEIKQCLYSFGQSIV